MALILCRKPGESVVFSFQDAQNKEQHIRLLVRRTFNNHKTEVQYSATCAFSIHSFIDEQELHEYTETDPYMTVMHAGDDVYVQGLSDICGDLDLSINIIHRSRYQVLIQINADSAITVLRDELLNAA